MAIAVEVGLLSGKTAIVKVDLDEEAGEPGTLNPEP